MTEEDARENYLRIASVIKGTKFQWILEEVEQEILRGKPSQKRLKVQKAEESFWATDAQVSHEKQSLAKFTASIEYTAEEQVALLIDALEQATSEAASMEISTALILNEICQRKEGPGQVTIEFRGEGETPALHRSTPQGRRELISWQKSISSLLEELKEEINAN